MLKLQLVTIIIFQSLLLLLSQLAGLDLRTVSLDSILVAHASASKDL